MPTFMQIIEILKGLDTQLFLLINGLHSPFFDNFMWIVSTKFSWIPLYLSVLYLLIRTHKKESIWIILSIVLSIVISDQLASGLLKELVKRLRPSHVDDLKSVIHLVKGYEGSLYGFASSHAANSVGFALLTSLIFTDRFYSLSMLFWALLVSYSRVYLGVHYPGDILGGIVIGTSAAFFCYWLIYKIKPQLLTHKVLRPRESHTIIPLSILVLSLLTIAVYSFVG
ncbi:MAG: phosphatase PAP2 family protein [Paludibacter sp.]